MEEQNNAYTSVDSALPAPVRLSAPGPIRKGLREQLRRCGGPGRHPLLGQMQCLRRGDALPVLETILVFEVGAQLAPAPGHIPVALFCDGGPWTWLLSPADLDENAWHIFQDLGGFDLQATACEAMRSLSAKGAAAGGLLPCRPVEIVMAVAWVAAKDECTRVQADEHQPALLIRATAGERAALGLFCHQMAPPGTLEGYAASRGLPVSSWFSSPEAR